MTTATPLRAAAFVQSLGVNTHLNYTDGKYANVQNVINDLRYLGIDHVRDNSLNPASQGQANYGVAADAGVKFDMVIGGWYDIPKSLSLLRDFVGAHPGSVSAIEGPNEVNNWPVTFQGLTGDAGAVAFQTALFNSVNADNALASIPVYNVTSWPEIGAPADYANFHSYPWNGDQPYARLANDFRNEAAVMNGKPMVLTEGGYYTLPNDNPGWGGVDQATQAKLTLNLFLDAAKLGVKQTYTYELLDAYADPNNSDQEKHFGLFDLNNNPKLAATAIHNLTTILADNGAAAGSFATADFNFDLSGLPGTGSSLVLEKSNGTYDLVLWNEPDIWNESSHTPIAAGASTVTVQLGQSGQISVYDPLKGTTAIQTATGDEVKVQLTDHPLIIEVTPGSGGSAPAPAPTPTPTPEPAPAPAPTQPAPSTPSSQGISVRGDKYSNSISGGSGADTILGLDGKDTVSGGAGDDSLNGNAGNDSVTSGAGRDVLHGGAGTDWLFGGADNDQLYGDLGNDTLSGDRGADTLTGGDGADRFLIGADSGADLITDFNGRAGDRIEVVGGVDYQIHGNGRGDALIMVGDTVVTLAGVNPSQLDNWIVG